LRSLSAVLPALPGFPSPQTRSPWPVWRNSVAGPVRFAPLSRKQAANLWHQARRWDRDTCQPGRHGGIIGRAALAALYARRRPGDPLRLQELSNIATAMRVATVATNDVLFHSPEPRILTNEVVLQPWQGRHNKAQHAKWRSLDSAYETSRRLTQARA
jgi:hypothetical protein